MKRDSRSTVTKVPRDVGSSLIMRRMASQASIAAMVDTTAPIAGVSPDASMHSANMHLRHAVLPGTQVVS